MELKFVGKEKREKSIIKVKDVVIGEDDFVIFAGPCAIESESQIIETALHVREAGARILRGGAFKPRTSPYSFQGLGEEGLKFMHKAGKIANMPVITEVMDPRDVEIVERYVDIFQVGSRNMQNFSLLRELGKTKKPVMLKRGLAASIEEWLLATEYIASEGNEQIILCERGIRTFESYTRNTLDLMAIPIIKQLSHLPIIVDPSHGTGRKELIVPASRAAVAVGADGLMVEVHPNPCEALSDGMQSMDFPEFKNLSKEISLIKQCMNSFS